MSSPMAARGPDPSDLLPMVGDIVERYTENSADTSSAHCPLPPSASPQAAATTSLTPALRPVQAVIGQAFPLVRTRRSYGRPKASELMPGAPPSTTAAPSRFTGLSAHVQPHNGVSSMAGTLGMEDSEGSHVPVPRMPLSEGGGAPMQAAGGSAQQQLPAHQWSAAEFAQLRCGSYVTATVASPSPSDSPTAPIVTTATGAPPTGEDFFTLLFQCMRSTVRKHQQLALEVLLAHLQGLAVRESLTTTEAAAAAVDEKQHAEAAALRERCLHGPNCGPFLFFLLEVLASAGHPAMIELATTCLLLLLRGLPRGATASNGGGDSQLEGCDGVSLLTDAISELGNPAGDTPDDDDGGEEEEDEARKKNTTPADSAAEKTSTRDDVELPFSEVSELLRGPDARYGLEQLGFTNKVLAAMQLLLYAEAEEDNRSELNTETEGFHRPLSSPTKAHLPLRHSQVLFLELLLCGGVGIGQRAACRRVAEDPHFLSWMEGQLSAVVLGHRALEEMMELMCVVQHLAHAPRALCSLLSGGPPGSHSSKGDAPQGLAVRDGIKAATAATSPQRQQQRFHETWLLFFIYACSTVVKEVRTVRHVFAIAWAMLFLRACLRQGGRGNGGAASPTSASPALGLVYDISTTLLTEGMSVGGALVLEMWFLQYLHATEGGAAGQRQEGSLDGFFLDAARTALLQCQRWAVSEDETGNEGEEAVQDISAGSPEPRTAGTPAELGERSVRAQEAEAAQSFLRSLQWTANTHFFSTYITQMRQHAPAVCYTLSGSAVETQEAMQSVVRRVVMDPARLTRAFQRFTTPLLSPSPPAATHSTSVGASEVGFSASSSSSPSTTVDRAATARHGWAPAVQAVLGRWISPTKTTVSSDRDSSAAAHTSESHTQHVPLTFSPPNMAVLRLSFDAATLYANTRLAAALAEVYPAVARDVVTGYGALLVHAYEEACLRLRDAAPLRLQVDELCTMAEAVQILQRFGTATNANSSNGVAEGNGGSAAGESAMALTRTASDNKRAAATGPTAETHARYDREARIGAFFLLHSIAISKHCLDVVPLILPLVQFIPSSSSSPFASSSLATFTADPFSIETHLAFLSSLQSGIELTPVPMMLSSSSSSAAVIAVTGAPRSWVMYPLYDSAFSAKHLWAWWLRGLLGLHRRMKDVVGWDGLLSHTLLWMLTHRRALWATLGAEAGDATSPQSQKAALLETKQCSEQAVMDREEEEGEEENVSPASSTAMCALTFDLCVVLHDQSTPRASGSARGGTQMPISAAASRTLEISLSAYSDVPSEEGLPLLLHATLAYVAGHCSAKTALAALQVLLATPILSIPSERSGWVALVTTGIEAKEGKESQSASFSYAVATTQVCTWLQAWSTLQGQQAQSAHSAHWSLDDVVSLVQLVGPHLSCTDTSDNNGDDDWTESQESGALMDLSTTGKPWDTDELWCARCLTEGLLRYYLQQRRSTSGALSAMEKAVLSSTLEELMWYPAVLWPFVRV